MTPEMQNIINTLIAIGETKRVLRELKEELTTALLNSDDVTVINICEAALTENETAVQV